MYNIKMNFETTIHVSVLTKELDDLLNRLGESYPKPMATRILSQTINIDNIEKIPNKELIENMVTALNDANKEVFQEKFNRNVTVGKTTFLGFTEIEELEEK